MTAGNGRRASRHLLFATRLAAVTDAPRWIAFRDRLIDLWMESPGWNSTYGMHFVEQPTTDSQHGSGQYAAGLRTMSTFHIGFIAESFYQAYLATGRPEIREQIVAMARFADTYGLDPTYLYSGIWLGVNINTDEPWHNYSANGVPTFWDPVYSTSLVNLLVMGSMYTGDGQLYNRAKYFFNRSSKARARQNSMPVRLTPDDEVDHFVDSVFSSSSGDFFRAFNKGELHYTYLMFDPAARGAGDFIAPEAPTNITIK
jgi:hypothetical protein